MVLSSAPSTPQLLHRLDLRGRHDAWREYLEGNSKVRSAFKCFLRQFSPPVFALCGALACVSAIRLHPRVTPVYTGPNPILSVENLPAEVNEIVLSVLFLCGTLACVAAFALVSRRRLREQFTLLLQVTAEMLARRAEYEVQEAKLAMLEKELEDASSSYDELLRLCTNRVLLDDVNDEFDRGHLLEPPAPCEIAPEDLGKPDRVLRVALQGRRADWTAAIRAASQIRQPSYSLKDFYDDVRVAFPELSLYTAVRKTALQGTADTSSGVSGKDEYRRTIGAMFAVYWLARIGIDGERGFSLGVDEEWLPRQLPETEAAEAELVAQNGAMAKRLAFYRTQDWETLLQLFIDAGILEKDVAPEKRRISIPTSPRRSDEIPTSPRRSEDFSLTPSRASSAPAGPSPSQKCTSGLQVHVERMVGILALTAFHDIMKVEALLPTVDAAVAPNGHQGFKPGTMINDHDVALGYVLTYYGHLLPSFASLPPKQQASVRFTQSKMSFNHGWLVQAEAPPKALFGPFKSVITSGGAAAADVAFYFVHWLTDLAGAEPTPLEGSEKFVLKFPHPVLGSFIRSFGVINELADLSETAVFESYLEQMWQQLPPVFGPTSVPTGDTAIALMRLVVQAQTVEKQQAVVDAFGKLSAEDRTVLSEEMARTGADDQEYSRTKLPKRGNPAILVYYSPAFVRTLTPLDALDALKCLTEIYRQARRLWPLSTALISKSTGSSSGPSGEAGVQDGAGSTVTVRIDQIKELRLDEIQSVYSCGESWLLAKRNDLEAVVERHTLDHMSELLRNGVPCQLLNFWMKEKGTKSGEGLNSPPESDGGSIRSISSRDSSFNRSGRTALTSTSVVGRPQSRGPTPPIA